MQEEYTEIEIEEKQGWKGKIDSFLSGKYFVPIVIILVAIIAFSLGRISGLDEKKEPVRVLGNSVTASENNPLYTKVEIETKNSTPNTQQTAAVGASDTGGGSVVASKNGTKYHYPWCAGAKQISEKNKISFASIEEARKAGYTPASNCKGLK